MWQLVQLGLISAMPFLLAIQAKAGSQVENIASIYHGGTPFMVSTHFENSPKVPQSDTTPPGIYKKNKGQWDILFPGRVLTDDRKGPFVYQLAVSKSDDRFTSLTVIDGQMYLITSLSSAENPDSYIKLGSKESPLYELETLQKRYLPELNSARNIAIYQNDSNLDKNGSQLILISVSFDKPTPVGDAMTFAFGIRPNPGSEKLELVGNPYVIDHSFHEPLQLQRILISSKTNEQLIYSESVFDRFLNIDLTSYGEYAEIIRNDYMREIRAKMKDQKSIPFLCGIRCFNFTTQKMQGEPIYSLSKTANSFSATEEMNLRLGTKQTVFRSTNAAPSATGSVVINELLDLFSPHAHDWKIWTINNPDRFGIFMVGGVLHLLFHPEGTERILLQRIGSIREVFGARDTEFPLTEFGDLTFQAQVKSKVDQKEVGIILSIQNTKRQSGRTSLLRFRVYDKEVMVPRGTFILTDYFLPTEHIRARTLGTSNNNYLFDVVTPITNSVAAYTQTYDASKPHLSVMESDSDHELVYKYNRPSKVRDIKNGISFATFSQIANIPNPTGLYFATDEEPNVTGNEENRVLGQLLQKRTAEGSQKEDLFLAHYDLRSYQWLNSALNTKAPIDDPDEYIQAHTNEEVRDIYVFAVDANNQQGEKGYNLVIASNFGSASSRFVYKTISLNGSLLGQFKYLKDISFVRGRMIHNLYVSIILSFKDPKGMEATYYVPLYLKNFEKANPMIHKLMESTITPKELGDRMAFDEEGAPFFILTPELSEDSVKLSMMSLMENRVTFPNQDYTSKRTNFKIGAKIGSDLSYFVPYKDSWRSFPADIDKNFKPSRGKEVEEFESFIELKNQLHRLSNPDVPPERLILVVPQSLRNLVWEFILGLYLEIENSKQGQHFSRYNKKVVLSIFDHQKSSQEQFFENLKGMNLSMESGERSLLLARMDELLKEKNPQSETGNAFNIVDVSANDGKDITDVRAVKSHKLPHALYYLAANAPLSLEDFRRDMPAPKFSSVILATKEELELIDSDARSEIDYGMMKAFQIKEIRNPDQDSMALSIERIFETPEVKSLDYRFSGKEIRPRSPLQEHENLSVIVDYAISRFNALVEQKKQSLFESFMRFRAAFASAVISDRQIRQSRVINKFFVERVLNQVFDIPLNLETLPPDDPIRLLSRKDAVLKLQEAGYSGPFDLKTKVIRTVLSQTLADAGKPIPSSTILFGETGAGKTFMFVSLVKMLGLQLYDINASNADNTNASAIIINVGKIVEDGNKDDSQSLTASAAIKHLNTFLSLNNGYRGWILIDDVHAASDKVKAEILSWLRGTFEAPGGLYSTVKGARRPIRNLNIFMTLNPTADQEQIARFAKDKSKPTTEELLLATLSTNQFKVEPSFLRRWNSIINLNYMPVGAKGPELIKSLAEASKNLLNSRSKIAFVDPSIIRRLVSENEKLDARSFLSASTSSLIDMASKSDTPGSVALIVPSMSARGPVGSAFAIDGSATEKIDIWVNNHTRAIALDSSLEGNLAMMQLVVNAFRVPLYEFLIGALQEDIRFSGDVQNQKALLAPILAAIGDHLTRHSDLPLSELALKPSEFGQTSGSQREAFKRALQSVSPIAGTHFPANFGRPNESTSWKELYGQDHNPEHEFSRQNIIGETISLNHQSIEKHLKTLLKIQDLEELPDPFHWLMQLTPADQQVLKKVGKEMANILWDFLPKMFADDLMELNGIGSRDVLSVYGAARLYLYSLDKAITHLPWVRTNRFILNSLDLITQDQVLSQKSGVQAFLFTDRYRLLKPTITDLAFQMISNSPVVDTIPVKTREGLRQRFNMDCESYLTPPKEK